MSNGLRVLVCGGRNYKEREAVFSALTAIDRKHGVGCIIQGGAPGADLLAARWARQERKPCLEIEALWTEFGSRAGPIRNYWMIQWCSPDVVVAFPGGDGTQNMKAQAKQAGLRIWEPVA